MGDDTPFEQQFSRPGAEQGPGPDCPPQAKLAQAVAGELDSPETRAIIDHVAKCTWCTYQWRVLDGREDQRDTGRSRMGLWIIIALFMIMGALMMSHLLVGPLTGGADTPQQSEPVHQ